MKVKGRTMTEPTDDELQDLWSDAVLPDTVTKRLAFSFVRAVLAKWGTLRTEKIVIPTDTMEQEFQKHYLRGFAAGKKANQPAHGGEPVGEVVWAAGVPNSIREVHLKKQGLPIGTKLYTTPQAIPGVQWQCGPQASGFTAPQADGQPAVAAKERKARESAQATGTDSSGAAQVDYSYAWRPIDDNTPRGTKLQLISRRDGVATYGHLGTDAGFWTHWAPLPTFRTETTPCGS